MPGTVNQPEVLEHQALRGHAALFLGLSVTAAGLVGGLLSSAFGSFFGHPLRVGPMADILISAALGAGAGIVFVFLIANTERSDRLRLLALALLAGFFWQPVWEGGRALIERQTDVRRGEEVKAILSNAQETARQVALGTVAQRPERVQVLNEQLARASALAGQIHDVRTLEALSPSLQAIAGELASTRDVTVPAAASLAQHWDAPRAADQLRQLSDDTRTSLLASLEPSRALAATAAGGVPSSSLAPRKLERTDVPATESLQRLMAGEEYRVQPPDGARLAWLRVALESGSNVTLAIRASGGNDLVAALYNMESLVLEAVDDDTDGRNPSIRARLAPGTYLLRISDYAGDALEPLSVTFTISAS